MSQTTHSGKARTVGAMFERIAPRYDLMNQLMSMGLDRNWRRLAVQAASPAPGSLVLDVGAGTADLTVALARDGRPRRIVGADLSSGMLARGIDKARSTRLAGCLDLVQADVLYLPFANCRFDCITTAFMVRNLADLPAALSEMRRVLVGSGRLVILEITRPRPGLIGDLFSLYFHRVVPLIGSLVSGDSAAYSYLPASVDRFLSAEALSAELVQAGFNEVRFRRLGPGPVALHVAVRKDAG
ncbi:MAG: bifunctional demethylmenaquinone methyltransferase/2-methoxy-6-polyprenyl-1,4-benzoquinol methylase UbiE [Dehalococcoidia bacterium]